MFYNRRRHNPTDPKDLSWLPPKRETMRPAFSRSDSQPAYEPPKREPAAFIGDEQIENGGVYDGRDLRQAVFDPTAPKDPWNSQSRAGRLVLIGCSFEGANLQGWTIKEAIFVECSFEGADLRYSDFKNVRFEGCNFAEADFRDATFNEVMFTNADKDGDLVNCNLDDAILCNAKFDGSVQFDIDTSAIGADFSGCVINGLFEASADFTDAVFDNLEFSSGWGTVNLSTCTLRGASAKNIDGRREGSIQFPPYYNRGDFEGLDLTGSFVSTSEITGLSEAIRFEHWCDRNVPNYHMDEYSVVFGQPWWRATRYRAVASDGTIVYDGRDVEELKSDLRDYFRENQNPRPVHIVEDGYREATEEELRENNEPHIRVRKERTVRR